MPKRSVVLLLPCFFVGVAPAATIDFTFKGLAVEASLNGGPASKIDLSVDRLADTANLVKGGGMGWIGPVSQPDGIFFEQGAWAFECGGGDSLGRAYRRSGGWLRSVQKRHRPVGLGRSD